ncbi:Deoxyguanosinetriphosphate triphosphohydrolase, partial [hydrothermal vent metagenome]
MNWNQLLSSARSGSQTTAQQQERSNFEADYDRIIFSYPFRRLQDKTQVFPLPEQDFVHNRLTHSLEVSSVGRTLGKRAGEKVIERYG